MESVKGEVAEPQKTDTTEVNFAKLRTKLEAYEHKAAEETRRREELERKLAQLEEQKSSKVQDDDDDDFLYKSEFSKTLKEREEAIERRLEKKIADQKLKERQELFKQKYGDYQNVVTEENLQKLKNYDPHFVGLVPLVSDEIERCSRTYDKIKEMQEKQAPKKVEVNNQRANLFASPFSGGSSPLSGIDGMRDPGTRQAAYQRMQEMKRGFNRG